MGICSHKPSNASLFSDRHTTRANSSCAPPHAKAKKGSEPTPVRSSNAPAYTPFEPTRPVQYGVYEDATALTDSQHSARSGNGTSVKSSFQHGAYSVISANEKSTSSYSLKLSTPAVIATKASRALLEASSTINQLSLELSLVRRYIGMVMESLSFPLEELLKDTYFKLVLHICWTSISCTAIS
jgi:hypothetical protein